MIVQLSEIANKTSNMVPFSSGEFGVTEATQRNMLGAYLNVAEAFLAARVEAKRLTGFVTPNTLPKIVVTYSTQTKAKKRVEGRDYRGIPGVAYDTHIGPPVVVRRTADGNVLFTLLDDNRAGKANPFTSIRLEGIRTFAFQDPKVQEKFLTAASVALGT